MKKLMLISVLATATYTSYAQSPTLAIRNYVLGVYTGTYLDYATYPDFDTLQSGVKMTALPNDTAGIISNDTINNIIDTLFVGFFYDLNNTIVDTILYFPDFIDCGDVYPAKDSIFYGRCKESNGWNPIGYISLKCTQHQFQTSINEWDNPNFSIYPNPTIDKLYISSEQEVFKSYFIYTIYGQLVANGIYSTTIELGGLPNGMYYLKLSGKTEAVKSFIKQ